MTEVLPLQTASDRINAIAKVLSTKHPSYIIIVHKFGPDPVVVNLPEQPVDYVKAVA